MPWKKLLLHLSGLVLLPSVLWGQIVDVEMGDNFFAPANLTIQKGETVRWTNLGLLIHTTTADGGAWNSGTLSSNETFQFTFNQAGFYRYYCAIHGGPGGIGMSGTVTVVDPFKNVPAFSWVGLALLFCSLCGAGLWFLRKAKPAT